MPQFDLTCDDPNHAARSEESDWDAVLGTVEIDEEPTQSGMICRACMRIAGGKSLVDNRAQRISEIDAKTRELIAKGFEHSEMTFSLSANAQHKITHLDSLKGSLSYPVSVENIDSTGQLSLADSSDVAAWAEAARARLQVVLDGGASLKQQARDASTIAAVRGVVDSRS
jgi:hypothetical protein